MCVFISFVFLLAAATVNSQCLSGKDGKPGTLTLTTLVNGSSSEPSVPIVDIITPDCSSLNRQLVVCNGEQGPVGIPGEQGLQGIHGLAATILTLHDQFSCSLLPQSGLRVCNGSTSIGLPGLQGSQGIKGLPGIRGLPGTPPQQRIAVVGNGAQYPATRAGLQSAINDVSARGGGTVFVTVQRIVSDGTPLFLQNRVMVDFMGGEFAMAPTSDSYFLIEQDYHYGYYFLVRDANAGDTVFYIPPWGGILFLPGDLAFTSNYEVFVVQSVIPSQGAVFVRSPIVQSYTVASGALLKLVVQPLMDAGIRNAVLNGNGNTGPASYLAMMNGMIRFRMEHVTITGTYGNIGGGPSGCIGICFFFFADSLFRDIRSLILSPTSGGERDITLQYQTGTVTYNLHSTRSKGFGPNVATATYAIVSGVITEYQQSRGYRVDQTANSIIHNVITNNQQTTGGVGIFISAFGSNSNMFRNVIALSNAEEGLGLQGASNTEIFNQINGFVSWGNLVGIAINSGPGFPAAGNFFMGSLNDGINSAGGSEPMPNCDWNQLDGSMGGAEYLHNSPPLLSDFFSPGDSSAWLVVSKDGTNTGLVFNVRGTDGILRKATLALH